MSSKSNPIWERYVEHRDLGRLQEDLLTDPWYETPETAEVSLLMRAVEQKDSGAAQFLISAGESPRLPASDGFTFLHEAIDQVSSAEATCDRDSALAVLITLLEGGADPNVHGVDGTPLHRAARHGDVTSARILLSYGADLEARLLVDGELTPLMYAALMNQPTMVRFLLDAGADRLAISRKSLTQSPMSLRQLLATWSPPRVNEILEMLDE